MESSTSTGAFVTNCRFSLIIAFDKHLEFRRLIASWARIKFKVIKLNIAGNYWVGWPKRKKNYTKRSNV